MARAGRIPTFTVVCATMIVVGVPPAIAATTTEPSDEDLNTWALEYTGGPGGEASGEPIRIGYANVEFFVPEATVGLNAAVEYVNTELGGVAGRPIEIVACPVNSAEEAALCGAEFANDDSIALVLTGGLVFGNKELYDALSGKKPVIIGTSATIDDLVTPVGVSYTAGAVGVLAGLVTLIIEDLQPTRVAVIAQDNPAGRAATPVIVQPAFDAAGIEFTEAFVADTATAPDVASAMQAAGVEDADILLSLVGVTQCINMYDAIGSLAIDPVVVTTGLCFGTPMTQHLENVGVGGDVPEGWYFGGFGYSYFRPDYESGMATYIAKIQQYGEPVGGASEIEYTGISGPTFANLLTAVKFINTVGPDDLTFETLDEQIRGFTGPMMLQAGPIECGVAPFVAICGHQMGIQQYVDGAWVSVHDSLNGEPVDVTLPG